VCAVARDFFDPSPEQQNVVLVDTATLREAERLIESCEGSNWPFAQRFDIRIVNTAVLTGIFKKLMSPPPRRSAAGHHW
jgi:hypothetical protein